MVSVTLTGLRLASAVADGKAGISRRPATEDGGVINSRRLRLALVREMTLQWETNDCGMTCTFTSALLRICCSRRLIEQVVHPNGHGAQDFWVRTLVERDRGRNAISGHQQHPGRPPLNFAHDQLPFMQGHNAPAWADPEALPAANTGCGIFMIRNLIIYNNFTGFNET